MYSARHTPARPLVLSCLLDCICPHLPASSEYLTGFHKRKQARRRFGLAMQEIKDRKERLEERKDVRLDSKVFVLVFSHVVNVCLSF